MPCLTYLVQLLPRISLAEVFQPEISSVVGQETPTYTTIKDLKYLKWVLNESLRLMPPVAGNSRQAIRDTILPTGGGPEGKDPILIRQGQRCAYHIWSTHRLSEFYGQNALEFEPKRWETLRPGWEYLPFNGGPRICLGQQYALMEASYTTIRLIQRYSRIESGDSSPWAESFKLTLSSRNGCKVAMFRDSLATNA